MKITTRMKAIQWWNTLSFEDKFYKTINWLSIHNRNTTERHPDNLTDREIQEIYQLENK